MELQGERLIPATVPQTWEALNDPETLKGCIAGCETLERVGDDGFTAVVAVKVGPVSARFKGNLKLTNVQAPDSYTINFDGQGGVAGFGKGSADVALSPEGGQTRLKYLARAQVGGKMAQVGSRLIDAAAGKIAEDFFKAFEATLTARYPAPAAAPAADAAGASASAAVAAPATAVAPAPEAGGSRLLWWVVGAVVLLALVVFATR
ncbi:CoxG family protein [Piscinibacter sakaiensis]|uniref:Carbon monoxide dehydrogenase G protein n=1 Tax=Piscinibacter sakaiensis TaxID=1547922 RepID=A0A0K8P328_PISS1|nr:carbon monoxide dehydrogenase subunit G [Piscinibacter sakaiensis]GAP36934.1 carbon monoxide dehydrogenase G protein [Piscinibacter sakaiensis]